MTEPKRLIDSDSGRLRALVEAGKRDLPDRHVEEKVLGALGLGAAGAAGLIPAASGGVARSALGRALNGLGRAALSKVGVGVIAAIAASGAASLAGSVHEHAREAATARASSVPPPIAFLPLQPPASDESTASAATVPSPATAASLASTAPTAAVAPEFGGRKPSALAVAAAATRARSRDDMPPVDQARVASSAHSLAAQLDSIRRARALISARDPGAALVELDAYEAGFADGIFEEEVMALRVRALRLEGDTAGAERERTNLQSRFPQSVHLATLGK